MTTTEVEPNPLVRRWTSPSAQYEIITPAIAEQYLAKNEINRTVRKSAVEAYARDMADGEWVITGEAIQFDWFDRMIDGQHRLLAIIMSGVSIQFLVVRGLDPKAQKRIDSGIIRAFADQLKMANIPEPFSVASALRRIHLYENAAERVDFATGKVTHAELEEAFDKHPEIVETVVKLKNSAPRIGVPVSMLAFVHWLLGEHNSEKTEEFFELFLRGANLALDDPILVLRDRIRREREQYTQREFQVRAFWLTVQAWNHWRGGRKISRLQLPSKITAEAFPGVMV